LKKLWIYILVVAAVSILATAMTAPAEDALKIVYNVGVAPLKFEREFVSTELSLFYYLKENFLTNIFELED